MGKNNAVLKINADDSNASKTLIRKKIWYKKN